jgi:hypothetical protein
MVKPANFKFNCIATAQPSTFLIELLPAIHSACHYHLTQELFDSDDEPSKIWHMRMNGLVPAKNTSPMIHLVTSYKLIMSCFAFHIHIQGY